MICKTNQWQDKTGWETQSVCEQSQLVIYFISPNIENKTERGLEIKKMYPNAQIIGSTSGGEIFNDEVSLNSVSLAAMSFANTPIRCISLDISDSNESHTVGKKIGEGLKKDDLNAILLFSDGLQTNGTALIEGLTSEVGKNVTITGGLAGDNEKFIQTQLGLNEDLKNNKTIAIGLYGEDVVIGHGSAGGWDHFGPTRRITKSEGNVLFELDGQPALTLYKKYLTPDQVKDLPGSGLLFPLSIAPENEPDKHIVRTIVGVNEEDQSLIFAGDIKQGDMARLMMGSFDRLIDGAAQAAEKAVESSSQVEGDRLSLMVSCIGRRLLMGQQISDEAEAAFETFTHKTKSIGFYSYGEISPHPKSGFCSLHNQTMTISIIGEKKAA